MNAAEILIAARAVIGEPKAWIKGMNARAADGIEVDSHDPNAVCFCALGAVNRVTERFGDGHCARDALREAINDFSIDNWNDDPETTHADVLAAFDKAIKKAQQAETGVEQS